MRPRFHHSEPVHAWPRNPRAGGRAAVHSHRPAFTLVELLVVVTIIVILMGMMAAGILGARGSQKKQATQALITRIDRVIQQQYSSYASRVAPGAKSADERGIFLRRLASAELPDNWADVQAIATGTVTAFGSGTTPLLPRTSPQRIYVNLLASSTSSPTPQFADAECLFMIVMQGGVADCLDCGDLQSAQIGDQDTNTDGKVVGDGWPEFLDAWGNPIRFVLWPAGLQLPPRSNEFFSSTAPFSSGSPNAAKGGTMRPLIFSCGPDGNRLMKRPPSETPGPSLVVTSTTGNLANGVNCGVPAVTPQLGTPIWRANPDDELPENNITNFDAEIGR